MFQRPTSRSAVQVPSVNKAQDWKYRNEGSNCQNMHYKHYTEVLKSIRLDQKISSLSYNSFICVPKLNHK